jgi:hypothetical protein
MEKKEALHCNCKKGRCSGCQKCTVCQCVCNGPVQKRSNTRGRPTGSTSSLQTKRQRRPKQKEVARMPRRITPSPPSTRCQWNKHDSPIVGSPTTIATALLMDKQKASTPEQLILASKFLFHTNRSQYYLSKEDEESQIVSKPSVKASLETTAGPIIHSIGDILDAFIDDPVERASITPIFVAVLSYSMANSHFLVVHIPHLPTKPLVDASFVVVVQDEGFRSRRYVSSKSRRWIQPSANRKD